METGAQTARKCEEVLNEIIEGTQGLSQMVKDISSSSKEQSRGVDEIAKAIIQLDEVTQSNASGCRESANTSVKLADQASFVRNSVNELMLAFTGAVPSKDLEGGERPDIRSKKKGRLT